jgi:hypothetical protein
MKVEDYRKAYTTEIESAKQRAASGPVTMSTGPAALAATDSMDPVTAAIRTFRDPAQPAEARLDALQIVMTATFGGPHFDRYRPGFRDALREVVAHDKNQNLRASALELLAMDKDELAKNLLLKGLDNQADAIVSPAKAVQLLGHDDHGVAIPVARRIIAGKYGDDAKEEALRVLASDPNSASLFAEILSDRSQPERLRSASVAGLRAVSPQRFAEVAQRLIVDEHDHDAVRASALGALNHLQGFSTKADPTFADTLSRLDLTGKSDDFRAAATNFLQASAPK